MKKKSRLGVIIALALMIYPQLIFKDNPNRIYAFEEETKVKIYEVTVIYKRLNYEQFKKWGEDFLFRQKVSGNYSTEELYHFRRRYEEMLKVFKDSKDVEFMVNDAGDFYVVNYSVEGE